MKLLVKNTSFRAICQNLGRRITFKRIFGKQVMGIRTRWNLIRMESWQCWNFGFC